MPCYEPTNRDYLIAEATDRQIEKEIANERKFFRHNSDVAQIACELHKLLAEFVPNWELQQRLSQSAKDWITEHQARDARKAARNGNRR